MKSYEILIESHIPNMRLVLKELATILTANHINYVVGGANALSIFSNRPRTTIDIDLFVDIDQKYTLESTLVENNFDIIYTKNYHSKFIKLGVEIDLLYAGNDAENNAIRTSNVGNILGVYVKVPTPEALLWLYILSDQEQNFVDGIQLIRSNPILNLERLKKELDPIETEKLDLMISRSSNISSSRKRN